MPAIADQVAGLEHDLSAALAKIDTLNATNGALLDMLNSLKAENAALNKYADEIKAMVESVAGSALNMLKAATAPIVAEAVNAAKTVIADVEKAVDSTVAPPLVPNAAPVPEPGPAPEPTVESKAAVLLQNIEHTLNAGVTTVKRDAAAVATQVAQIPEAVERMLNHSSASSAPPVTAIRQPVDMTMHVDHTDDGLPIFLRRGTVFQRGDQALI